MCHYAVAKPFRPGINFYLTERFSPLGAAVGAAGNGTEPGLDKTLHALAASHRTL